METVIGGMPQFFVAKRDAEPGACPNITMGRVPSVAGPDGRRRAAGDAEEHRRGAATLQMAPRRRNPLGAWGLRAISSLLVVDNAPRHRLPPRASSLPRKPRARDPS